MRFLYQPIYAHTEDANMNERKLTSFLIQLYLSSGKTGTERRLEAIKQTREKQQLKQTRNGRETAETNENANVYYHSYGPFAASPRRPEVKGDDRIWKWYKSRRRTDGGANLDSYFFSFIIAAPQNSAKEVRRRGKSIQRRDRR